MGDSMHSPDIARALEIAHHLVDLGVPVFPAPPNSSKPGEFLYPGMWPEYRPNHSAVDRWQPGWALAMVTGVVFDVLDIDPRNGGMDGLSELHRALGDLPELYGEAETPSAGRHLLIARTRLAKGKPAQGIDLQAGDDRGQGRGFVFIAPTVRVSRYGPRKGEPVMYRWTQEPIGAPGSAPDPTLASLVDLIGAARPLRRAPAAARPVDEEEDPFDSAGSVWTPAEAARVMDQQVLAVEQAREGEINSTLGGAARVLGRFVAGGHLSEESATELLLGALERGGVHDDRWNVANGKSWTAATVIGAGLARGAEEPWTVMQEAPARQTYTTPADCPDCTHEQACQRHYAGAPVSAPPAATVPGVFPPLAIGSAAEMAYWCQSNLGSGTTSGFFRRGGTIVHTARVGEIGYVPPADDRDDNGPAQVLPVTAGTLAAKVQYGHRCYKIVKDKESKEEREVPALFPRQAAEVAVNAPEALPMLRPLRGITLTPMVRADGTILTAPGYDEASGFLYLPDRGVRALAVPEDPTAGDVQAALGLLDEMLAGFPWVDKQDRANYLGLLLTPLLREVAPPTYKLFGITAHQPGSGKTLLADIVRLVHGGVLRSEMPDEEAEVRKMTTTTLATTSAPVIHVDNVTGILRSSALAGLLTARGEVSERELGTSRNLTFTNDRTWVVTGNNMALGGDLVRRTITIMIDPNVATPEAREFAIRDLPAWVEAHRSEILRALLVLIRSWWTAGAAPADRAQSDSFARWEAVVDGILRAAGVEGFDQASGARAARGGDDDGLLAVLEHAFRVMGENTWTAAELIDHVPAGEFVGESREWLPASVLDKLARSEAGGRKSFGRWLLNRIGRWVRSEDGGAYVLREAGKHKHSKVALWRVERKS